MRTTLFVFLLLISGSALAQSAFYKIFSDNGSDKASGVVQLPDSSYMVTGSSSSFYDGPSQAILLKLDPQGNMIWSRSYGGPETDAGQRVLYQENEGFFVCGLTNSFGAGGYDMYLAKMNENGDLLWEKSFGGSGWERTLDAALTPDSGVMMVGSTSSNAFDDEEMYIVRADKNGDTIWTREINGWGANYLNAIERINDTTYFVGGTWYNADSLQSKAYLASLHIDGSMNWSTELGANGSYLLKDFCIRQNQIVAVGGHYEADGNLDACRFFVDINGTLISENIYEGPGGNETYDAVSPVGDSTYLYMIWTYENAWSTPGGSDFNINRYAIPFNQLSSYIVYHENPDVPEQMIPTLDGGILVVSYATDNFKGSNDAIIIKIGPNDSMPDPDEFIGSIVSTPIVGNPEKFSMFPNPGNSFCSVHSPSAAYDQLSVYDISGKKVEDFTIQGNIEISTAHYPAGVYLLELYGASVPGIQQRLIIAH